MSVEITPAGSEAPHRWPHIRRFLRAELAGDHVKRHLVEKWTDGMAYCCRRSAAWARGEDPGDWVPQWERRPDLAATGRAIAAEIVTALDADGGHDTDRRAGCAA